MASPVPIPASFNDMELWAIHELANRRQGLKEKHGVKTKKVAEGLTDLDLHIVGRKSEYAVSRLLSVQLDMSDTQKGDSGIDLLYKGLAIDVKCSSGKNLKFKGTQPFKADIAVFCMPLTRPVTYENIHVEAEADSFISWYTHAWRNINIMGWVSRERFNQKAFTDIYGELCLNWHNLNDMRILGKYATQRGAIDVQSVIDRNTKILLGE